ncbi:cupin-like domain-containing protein [Croceicoccus sp. YJ47]|uniref:cupin-like domain-containing protein n=1 Tax=Croceicoccus sp. YJ47 TaxID=2798724 RepID=UPI0019231CC4|nr:cupin-like domain-containing protein [Croceicoccus sp. YJ47]QQN74966.1 cupin-like domain-containing protein [Croceicoccus sp. YJ47]
MAEADPGPLARLPSVPERAIGGEGGLDAALRDASEPFVIRGLAADWPLVAAGRRSSRAARDYLLGKAKDRPFAVSVGAPDDGGRLFYDAQMGMNFRSGRAMLPEIFGGMDAAEGKEDAATVYLASTDMHEFFDGLYEDNHIDLGDRSLISSIWIGTATRIAAHNDFPDNLACCAVGRRRFTLFPPDQFANLYLGPIDNTPAGRAVSMVDFHAPDLDAHPRFADALRHAVVAELEPGDALYIPSMWWHHVEALSTFNALVNFWWRDTPRWMGQPQNALNHAILSIRDLPDEQKQMWRQLFDHYVFENGPDVTDHIPENARSVLAPLTVESAGRLRAFLLRALSR